MRRQLAAALALLVLAPSAAFAQTPCLHNGETISGEVREVETRHPGNHQEMRTFVLVLAAPRCVHDSFGDGQGRWVQLALNAGQSAHLSVGQVATIRADYMTPETAWHIGDIVAINPVIISTDAP